MEAGCWWEWGTVFILRNGYVVCLCRLFMQVFSQEKIIAGRPIIIAGHIVIMGLIFSIF